MSKIKRKRKFSDEENKSRQEEGAKVKSRPRLESGRANTFTEAQSLVTLFASKYHSPGIKFKIVRRGCKKFTNFFDVAVYGAVPG